SRPALLGWHVQALPAAPGRRPYCARRRSLFTG
ncbi:hypothetical protein A2U01_0110806, partial [Trifolium medium]|nr:hypothetical protein [Trifolium medium]